MEVKEAGWLTKETKSLEPSSGDGVFLKYIPNLVCMDLCPKHDEATRQDFLKWKPAPGEKYDLVIGNPPFGRNNSLATKFINHAATFCNKIFMWERRDQIRPLFKELVDIKTEPHMAKTVEEATDWGPLLSNGGAGQKSNLK